MKEILWTVCRLFIINNLLRGGLPPPDKVGGLGWRVRTGDSSVDWRLQPDATSHGVCQFHFRPFMLVYIADPCASSSAFLSVSNVTVAPREPDVSSILRNNILSSSAKVTGSHPLLVSERTSNDYALHAQDRWWRVSICTPSASAFCRALIKAVIPTADLSI